MAAEAEIEQEAARVDAEKAANPELPGVGHNSDTADVGGVSGQRLRSYIERVERLNEEISGLRDDVKDIFAEAKAFGFDVPTLRKILKLRQMDTEKRREADDLLELYKAAIRMD